MMLGTKDTRYFVVGPNGKLEQRKSATETYSAGVKRPGCSDCEHTGYMCGCGRPWSNGGASGRSESCRMHGKVPCQCSRASDDG